MSWFDWLFGKSGAKSVSADAAQVVRSSKSQSSTARPAQVPPELERSTELQRAYWTFNAAELRELDTREASLTWPQRLRRHHLLCLQLVDEKADQKSAQEQCRQSLQRLLAEDSPYRPRVAAVWQGDMAKPDDEREPDHQALFFNASITHLGCLEVFHVNDDFEPTELAFISFDEIANIMFARASLLRGAKVFFEDGRDAVVLAPMLYGLTWELGNNYDRNGRMTRFISHLTGDFASLGSAGIGLGQQDFTVRDEQGEGVTLFGIGSVASIHFPLDMRDPRFDEKARARGIDPEQVRRQMASE